MAVEETRAEARQAHDRGAQLFYLPDEICVVVPQDLGSNREIYDKIREALNEELRQIIGGRELATQPQMAAEQILHAAIAADLAPAGGFQETLGRDLFPLGVLPDDEQLVVVPPSRKRVEGEPPAWTLAFYKVGTRDFRFKGGEGDPSEAEMEERAARIRALVNVLNLDVAPRLRGRFGGDLIVTPHWCFGPAQQYCPSPGAKPEPVDRQDAGRWTFKLVLKDRDHAGAIDARRQDKSPSQVVVAILDTAPEREEIDAAASRYPNNLLLHDLVNSPTVKLAGETISWDQSAFVPLDGYLPNWRNHLEGNIGHFGDTKFKMRDHGVFIAGIVYDLAPHAEIHLIRALGGYGLSTLRHVARKLIELPGALLKDDGQRLIVNLSLGASIPPGAYLARRWLPNAIRDLAPHLQAHPDFKTALAPASFVELRAYFAALQRSVALILDWIDEHPQILVIAAAGNDNDHFDSDSTLGRPEPRWPARAENRNVLGVAAVRRDDEPAAYSNRGDLQPLGNGVAVWGGEARDAGQDLGQIDAPPGADPDQVDAIKGIYSEQTLTLGGNNASGWAYWAGTSFATPIITGIAASLWAAFGNKRPDELIQMITSLATVEEMPANDPERLDTKAMRASQVWENR